MNVRRRQIPIDADGVILTGDLALPPDPAALVVFAHGSGSSRLSPRNIQVARRIHVGGLGTLLFDLLTEAESANRRDVFDIPLLGRRLTQGVRTVRRLVPDVPVGLFGASTGAAAAIVSAGGRSRTRLNVAPSVAPEDEELTALQKRVGQLAASGLTNQEMAEKLSISRRAVEDIISKVYDRIGVRSRAVVEHPEEHLGVFAIVSRGGRPDLADDALERVTAPTLLIVGELDREVLAINRDALARMRCETKLEIIPGATHLFEEPGALERVAELASGWFVRHAS